MTVDLQNICTAPPREWLAIHKETLEIAEVLALSVFDKVNNCRWVTVPPSGEGQYGNKERQWRLSDCHLCAFTGYIDSEKEKVYGGHLYTAKHDGHVLEGIYLVFHCPKRATWICRNICNTSEHYLEWVRSYEYTIIGHIHIPSEWPEEVAELLPKPKKRGGCGE